MTLTEMDTGASDVEMVEVDVVSHAAIYRVAV
jgi:hypothetical protein